MWNAVFAKLFGLMGVPMCYTDEDASPGFTGFSLHQVTSPFAEMQPLHPLHHCRVWHARICCSM